MKKQKWSYLSIIFRITLINYLPLILVHLIAPTKILYSKCAYNGSLSLGFLLAYLKKPWYISEFCLGIGRIGQVVSTAADRSLKSYQDVPNEGSKFILS